VSRKWVVIIDGGILSAILQVFTRYSANDPQFPVNGWSLFTGKCHAMHGALRPKSPTDGEGDAADRSAFAAKRRRSRRYVSRRSRHSGAEWCSRQTGAGSLLNPLRRLIQSPTRTVERMALVRTDRVLEIGCGPGYFSRAIRYSLFCRRSRITHELCPGAYHSARSQNAPTQSFSARAGNIGVCMITFIR
jgi:hypothetical protein